MLVRAGPVCLTRMNCSTTMSCRYASSLHYAPYTMNYHLINTPIIATNHFAGYLLIHNLVLESRSLVGHSARHVPIVVSCRTRSLVRNSALRSMSHWTGRQIHQFINFQVLRWNVTFLHVLLRASPEWLTACSKSVVLSASLLSHLSCTLMNTPHHTISPLPSPLHFFALIFLFRDCRECNPLPGSTAPCTKYYRGTMYCGYC